MSKELIIYWASCGLGENLQASAAMRALKRTRHVLLVARDPIHRVIHEDCFDELFTFAQGDPKSTADVIHRLKCRTADEPHPVPWTAHLDAPKPIVEELERLGFTAELLPREFPKTPTSASRAFYGRVTGQDAQGEDLRMIAAPPEEKRASDYDVLVSIGSAERMRRLPEAPLVAICNGLHRRGLRVVLHSHGAKPEGLHTKVGYARNGWSDGTIHQLKELVWGVKFVIGPDSGTNHLALAYGKKLVFLESREHVRGVVDAVYDDVCLPWRMDHPRCMMDCAARRKVFEEWPRLPEGYPFTIDCSKEENVPCLSIKQREVDELLDSDFVKGIL